MSPSAGEIPALEEKIDNLSREDLLEAYRTLRGLLAAVRECDNADGQCHLCPHCVTRLYVLAKPAPVSIPPRYTEKPWRRP